jgi:hypothetical protein
LQLSPLAFDPRLTPSVPDGEPPTYADDCGWAHPASQSNASGTSHVRIF